MRTNFESWIDFASSHSVGIGLSKEDIVFVSGTVKTMRWMVGVFQGDDVRAKKAHISGKVGPFAGLEFNVNAEDCTLPTTDYRYGPDAKPETGPVYPAVTNGTNGTPEMLSAQSQDSSSEAATQCIFIHYYKMKSRWKFPGIPMKGASGSHQLPREPDDPPSDASSSNPEETQSDDADLEFVSFPGPERTKASVGPIGRSHFATLLTKWLIIRTSILWTIF